MVEGTRLDTEVDFHTEHYGVAQQHMSIVTASDGISTAGVAASLDAEIAAWSASQILVGFTYQNIQRPGRAASS